MIRVESIVSGDGVLRELPPPPDCIGILLLEGGELMRGRLEIPGDKGQALSRGTAPSYDGIE
jgi:hypothetical protein